MTYNGSETFPGSWGEMFGNIKAQSLKTILGEKYQIKSLVITVILFWQ